MHTYITYTYNTKRREQILYKRAYLLSRITSPRFAFSEHIRTCRRSFDIVTLPNQPCVSSTDTTPQFHNGQRMFYFTHEVASANFQYICPSICDTTLIIYYIHVVLYDYFNGNIPDSRIGRLKYLGRTVFKIKCKWV